MSDTACENPSTAQDRKGEHPAQLLPQQHNTSMATTSEPQASLGKEGTAVKADDGVQPSAVTMQATIAPMEPNHMSYSAKSSNGFAASTNGIPTGWSPLTAYFFSKTTGSGSNNGAISNTSPVSNRTPCARRPNSGIDPLTPSAWFSNDLAQYTGSRNSSSNGLSSGAAPTPTLSNFDTSMYAPASTSLAANRYAPIATQAPQPPSWTWPSTSGLLDPAKTPTAAPTIDNYTRHAAVDWQTATAVGSVRRPAQDTPTTSSMLRYGSVSADKAQNYFNIEPTSGSGAEEGSMRNDHSALASHVGNGVWNQTFAVDTRSKGSFTFHQSNDSTRSFASTYSQNEVPSLSLSTLTPCNLEQATAAVEAVNTTMEGGNAAVVPWLPGAVNLTRTSQTLTCEDTRGRTLDMTPDLAQQQPIIGLPPATARAPRLRRPEESTSNVSSVFSTPDPDPTTTTATTIAPTQYGFYHAQSLNGGMPTLMSQAAWPSKMSALDGGQNLRSSTLMSWSSTSLSTSSQHASSPQSSMSDDGPTTATLFPSQTSLPVVTLGVPCPYASDAARWKAVQMRDSRASAAFFYCVMSTKIFCRTTCPSRRPVRENIFFVDSAAQASNLGYRACRRCKPNISGGDPHEEKQGDLIAKVKQRLLEGIYAGSNGKASKGKGLKYIAEDLGVSHWHLHRCFKKRVGLTPEAWAKSQARKMNASGLASMDDPRVESPVSETLHQPIGLHAAEREPSASGTSPLSPSGTNLALVLHGFGRSDKSHPGVSSWPSSNLDASAFAQGAATTAAAASSSSISSSSSSSLTTAAVASGSVDPRLAQSQSEFDCPSYGHANAMPVLC